MSSVNSACINRNGFIFNDLRKYLYLRCRNTHDIKAYLDQKPKDIKFPRDVDLVIPALISKDDNIVHQEAKTSVAPSIDPEAYCSVYEDKGTCRHGFKCRFLGGHVKKSESGELELISDEEKVARRVIETSELNYLPPESLKLLRSKKVMCIYIE